MPPRTTCRVARAGRMGLLLLVCLLGPAGCGPRTAAVSGKVAYRGKRLPAGRITFLGADGRVANGQINPDGTYQVQGVPVGEATITVSSQPSSPIVLGQGPKRGQAVGTRA